MPLINKNSTYRSQVTDILVNVPANVLHGRAGRGRAGAGARGQEGHVNMIIDMIMDLEWQPQLIMLTACPIMTWIRGISCHCSRKHILLARTLAAGTP